MRDRSFNPSNLIAIILLVLAALVAITSDAGAAPINQVESRTEKLRQDCTELNGSFESGSYDDDISGETISYGICLFESGNFVMCEFTETEDLGCEYAQRIVPDRGDPALPVDLAPGDAPLSTPTPTEPARARG